MITKVTCLNNNDAEASLTIGKTYEVIEEIEKISGKGVVIVDDTGVTHWWYLYRFESN